MAQRACFFLFLIVISVFGKDFKNTEKPLQIVQPDATHVNLVINEENLQALSSIEEELAVVSVVGPLHSGKSFFLNQLMGRVSGFKLGPTVEPSTRGLWMWGAPIQVTNSEGKKISVLFIDTEGFFANNVSESYDAKIFAVATLLSSHLIYNSVKIIDQASVEYLELLARRTQLFSIRSDLVTNTSHFPNNILYFPSLSWVVQDFFQEIEDESPTKWLHRLLSGFRRDSEDGKQEKMALNEIFPSIDCFTVFLPHSEKEQLRHLDQVKQEELTREYINNMNHFKDKLFQSLRIKKKGPNNLTGPGLASLLSILVKFANEGSFPDVPSVWSAFLKNQRQQSLSDSLEFYKSEFNKILTSQNVPLSEGEFQKISNETIERTKKLFIQLLFGLEANSQMNQLEEEIKEIYHRLENENIRKIDHFISKSQLDLENEYTNALNSIKLPTATQSLKSEHDSLLEKKKKEYKSKLNKYHESKEIYKKYLDLLQKNCDGIYYRVSDQNRVSIEKTYIQAVQSASSSFSQKIWGNTNPLSTSNLKQIYESTLNQAWKEFKEKTKGLEKEQTYEVFKNQAKDDMEQTFASFEQKNMQRVKDMLDREVAKKDEEFEKQISQLNSIIPIDQAEIEKRYDIIFKEVLRSFEREVSEFVDFPEYPVESEKLQEKMKKRFEELKLENLKKLKHKLQEAFNRARKILQQEASSYMITWSFRNYAIEVCEKEIGQSTFSADTRHQVISEFLEKDMASEFLILYLKTGALGLFLIGLIAIGLFAFGKLHVKKLETSPEEKPIPKEKKSITKEKNSTDT